MVGNSELNALFSTNFISVSRPMIRIFGIEAALMLCELYSEYRYYESKKRLEPDGYFYSTVENIEHNVGLSKGQQLRAIEQLSKYGIIKKAVRGMPGTRHFQFQYAAINKLKKDMEIELRKDKKSTVFGQCESYKMDKTPVKSWAGVDLTAGF